MNNFFWVFIALFLMGSNATAQNPKKAIAGALAHLRPLSEGTALSYNLRLLLWRLGEKYGFSEQLSPNLLATDTLLADDIVVYNFYNTLIHKENRQNQDSLFRYYQQSQDLDRILLWATNAEHLPFDDQCQKIAFQYCQPQSNIRQSAHLALAFYWAGSRMDAQARVFFSLHQSGLQRVLLQGIEAEKKPNDNWLEGLVGLLCLERRGLIKKQWIGQILTAQNADGGWAWDTNDATESHPHPTVLALWLLADYNKNKKGYAKP